MSSTPTPGGAPAKSGVHPGIVVGAIAVVVFGAAGAASYLGLLPGSGPAKPSVASARSRSSDTG